MGWQPNYQSEGRIYAAYILKNFPNGRSPHFGRMTMPARTR